MKIPNRPSGDYPHCDVRTYDLDLFVDHFSDWWIVAVIKRHFTAKRVVCTPYLQHPLPTGFTNILLYIHDDYHKVHKVRILGHLLHFFSFLCKFFTCIMVMRREKNVQILNFFCFFFEIFMTKLYPHTVFYRT